jgi:uncharacterized protein
MKPFSLVAVLLSGALFGAGLALSTMVKPEVVLSFLRLKDFGLLLVLGSATTITALVYQLLPRLARKPLFEAAFGKHVSLMNRDTLLGAAVFGIGWGISGVCPGPAIAGLGTGNLSLLWSIAGLFAGAYLHGWWMTRRTVVS